MRRNHHALLDFCEAIGIELSMDWDDKVTVEFTDPADLRQEQLDAAIKKVGGELAAQFKERASRERRVFVGGPMNGKAFHFGYTTFWCWESQRNYVLIHTARAKWDVYRIEGREEQAFYVGRATSKKKARSGQFVKH